MIVGAALLDIHVHGSRSLKQKRGVVRSIVQRVRNRFNLSVAEVGGQDTWQRATLALGAVGTDERLLRQALENALQQALQCRLVAGSPALQRRLRQLRSVVVVEMMDTILTTYRLPEHDASPEAEPVQREFVLH